MHKRYHDYIEALSIFMKYDPDGTCVLCAEHDVIYALVDTKKISAQDLNKLKELGWCITNDGKSFYTYT
ncbi:MAG: hypothetical protein WC444_04865 [Candidatus Paceibacterota bacterium]